MSKDLITYFGSVLVLICIIIALYSGLKPPDNTGHHMESYNATFFKCLELTKNPGEEIGDKAITACDRAAWDISEVSNFK